MTADRHEFVLFSDVDFATRSRRKKWATKAAFACIATLSLASLTLRGQTSTLSCVGLSTEDSRTPRLAIKWKVSLEAALDTCFQVTIDSTENRIVFVAEMPTR